ncbi:MAG: hypothetical protein BWY72_01628 [Bacteroidetes bacterium ADurb.Bin416]|nr:MAG: hypothetical protein BWY72_01628 [Bacteroidetes bacterium ADurb.Bin416]
MTEEKEGEPPMDNNREDFLEVVVVSGPIGERLRALASRSSNSSSRYLAVSSSSRLRTTWNKARRTDSSNCSALVLVRVRI